MKQRTNRSIKKRFYKTKNWKWKVMRAKACHSHRLIPKTKERKTEYWRPHDVCAADNSRLKNQFSLL